MTPIDCLRLARQHLIFTSLLFDVLLEAGGDRPVLRTPQRRVGPLANPIRPSRPRRRCASVPGGSPRYRDQSVMKPSSTRYRCWIHVRPASMLPPSTVSVVPVM